VSVILFAKAEVYQQLADAYEGLKHLRLGVSQEQDTAFYKSLRRLYFANVAAYLCQYHDDTPLSASELTAIDPFCELQGIPKAERTPVEDLHAFLAAWSSLQYNLVTNDGEHYEAKEACASLAQLAEYFSLEVARILAAEKK
jgi:hypothetical protein